jgi:hypothetical protein
MDALAVVSAYHKGEIDPVTHNKISERTYNVAKLVAALFAPITGSKEGRSVLTPKRNVMDELRTGFNSFINSINSQIKSAH